jgi:hypothetical protein
MGLYVRLNIQPDRIDAERWEAVWLTSLQLLEHFPGPLAAQIVDEQHQSRHVLTPRIHFQTGTNEEHWKVDGDLGSGRMGESYCLYRHLRHYRRNSRRTGSGKAAADILWLPAKELEMGKWRVCLCSTPRVRGSHTTMPCSPSLHWLKIFSPNRPWLTGTSLLWPYGAPQPAF